MAPASPVVSTKRSIRLPGPSPTRLSRARKGSAGWPSIAITRTACPSSLMKRPRAVVALTIRSRKRSPVFTAISGPARSVDEHRRTVGRSRCGEQERDLAIDVDRLGVLDDERAGEPAIGLAGNIGVVPERAGVGRPEAVIEARAGCYRWLGQLRYAVHGIGQPDAVPMHTGRRGELVDQPHAQLFAAPDPQCRPRRDAVIAQACITQAGRWQRAGAQQTETVGGGLRRRAGWQAGTGDRRSRRR